MSHTFAELGVSAPVVRALAQRGITQPFAIQKLVIEDVLEGRDVLAKSPTGSGKTLAFGIPLLETLSPAGRGVRGLVLAPTRELAAQIVDELAGPARALGLRLAAVYGGVGFGPQIAAVRKAHVVVATPGRLEDLLERGVVSLEDIEILVLDEADRMLDMGFRPAVDRIVRRCPDDRQTLFFSATLDGEAGRLAAAYTHEPARHEHAPREQAAVRVDHRFLAVEREERLQALVDQLRGDRGLALVFVRTKRGADRLVKQLGRAGVEAVAMHGDKSQGQRERALARFEAGHVDTLVATDVAARGIDIDDVSHVINFDPPEDREGYVHRIGRTGRAGRTGTGITFFGAEHADTVGKIAGELDLHDAFEETGFATRRQATHAGQRPARGSGGRGRARRRR